jgi:hypothetical protein
MSSLKTSYEMARTPFHTVFMHSLANQTANGIDRRRSLKGTAIKAISPCEYKSNAMKKGGKRIQSESYPSINIENLFLTSSSTFYPKLTGDA